MKTAEAIVEKDGSIADMSNSQLKALKYISLYGNDASFNKRENWTKIEKIVNFIYYPNKIDPFVKNGFFSENLFVDEPQHVARK